MYSDVVQLKLQKPSTEIDEGIPLTTLGTRIFFYWISHLQMNFFQVVEHVLISINIKIICSLSVPKKAKFINVRNRIIINSSIHSMHIIWQSIPFVGTHFIRRFSLVVQLIGPSKFGILISS